MAQLNVRLDDQTRDSFDALARARGLSASELIRSLIDSALGGLF
jgi:antitoxin component of RelBE/YafQ-DinJ toxin-antitoxin module